MPKRKLKEIMNNLDEDHLLKCIKSFGYLTVKEKQEKPEKEPKVRKNVDYPWSEYIVYIVCKGGSKITLFEEILSTFDESVPKGYLKDILRTNPKTVIDYYNRFYEEFQKMNIKVLQVFLLGKNQSRFPEIKKLHLNLVNVKLKAGSLILFPPYWTHPHGVSEINEIENGRKYRYTINCWALDDFLPSEESQKRPQMNNILIL